LCSHFDREKHRQNNNIGRTKLLDCCIGRNFITYTIERIYRTMLSTAYVATMLPKTTVKTITSTLQIKHMDMGSTTTAKLTVTIFMEGNNKFSWTGSWRIFTYISANPAHVIIPILVSIFLFPVLVIITICCIRIRNIKARKKKIKDWTKENKISKGI
jgi:hypothetical protein